MSLLIKGNLDLPNDCMGCPCRKDIELDFSGNMVESYCPVTKGYPDIPETVNYKLEGCPLIELPKQHGDLIDRNHLLKAMEEFYSKDDWCYHFVEIARTIIEAEETE